MECEALKLLACPAMRPKHNNVCGFSFSPCRLLGDFSVSPTLLCSSSLCCLCPPTIPTPCRMHAFFQSSPFWLYSQIPGRGTSQIVGSSFVPFLELLSLENFRSHSFLQSLKQVVHNTLPCHPPIHICNILPLLTLSCLQVTTVFHPPLFALLLLLIQSYWVQL